MALQVGEVIDGKYRIVRLIGEGGMGAVYEGQNILIQRRVAIKVLHRHVAANSDAVARFEREATAAGRIGSDHILEVLDMGTLATGQHYMVLEFLEGETLKDRIKRFGKLSSREAYGMMCQALVGLRAAHQVGIIHRDLKPDNIFILREKAGRPDFVKLIDFGISKFQSAGESHSITRTGSVMGTPFYMSPEQAKGSRDVDARSDLYAMGVILYEAVSGRVPYDAPTFNELLFRIVLADPTPLRAVAPQVDQAFESIILRAMARDVSQRFQSADEFLHALGQWAQSGAGVALPPRATEQQRLAAAVPGAVVVRGATRMLAGAVAQSTNDSWATPQVAESIDIPKTSGVRFVMAMIGGLVMLAAAAFALYKFASAPSADAAASAKAADARLIMPEDAARSTSTESPKVDVATTSGVASLDAGRAPASASAPWRDEPVDRSRAGTRKARVISAPLKRSSGAAPRVEPPKKNHSEDEDFGY